MRRRLLSTAALLLLAVIGCDRGSHPRLVGSAAPDFTLQDGSRTVTLSQFRGRPLLLNLWATWCAPCIEEIPSLEALHKQLPRVQVLAVATDTDADAYHQWMGAHMLSYDSVLDPGQQATSMFPTTGVPETYILDRDGRVARKFVGPQDWTSPAIVAYLKSL